MSKKLYDENGNEVEVKKKRSGCLQWLLYGFIAIIVLGACGALLGDDDDEEKDNEEQATEEVSEEKDETEDNTEDVDDEKEESKEEKEEFNTVEDIAKDKLGGDVEFSEYDGEMTITFEPMFSNNDERTLTILTNEISNFLLSIKDDATDLKDYDSYVIMAYYEDKNLYSLGISTDQFDDLPENDIDGQIELQFNMEDYVESVSMLPQYRQVDGF